MSGRHQPVAGADSEHIHQFTVEHEGVRICECGLVDPESPAPMMELPRPNLDLVRQYLRDNGIPPDQIDAEASKVVMADALGRAIHAARGTNPWPLKCAIYTYREEPRPVPYGYGDNGECSCEAMALELVSLMTAQAVTEGVKQSSRLVMPDGRKMN